MITLVVTPKVAQRILDDSGPLKYQCTDRCGSGGEDHQAKVDRFADVMLAGEWLPVAPLTFTTEGGPLCDGVHRLLAVIQSGCAVTFPVAFVF